MTLVTHCINAGARVTLVTHCSNALPVLHSHVSCFAFIVQSCVTYGLCFVLHSHVSCVAIVAQSCVMDCHCWCHVMLLLHNQVSCNAFIVQSCVMGCVCCTGGDWLKSVPL